MFKNDSTLKSEQWKKRFLWVLEVFRELTFPKNIRTLPNPQTPPKTPMHLDDSHLNAHPTSMRVPISRFSKKAIESSTASLNGQISICTLCSQLDILEKTFPNPHANCAL